MEELNVDDEEEEEEKEVGMLKPKWNGCGEGELFLSRKLRLVQASENMLTHASISS